MSRKRNPSWKVKMSQNPTMKYKPSLVIEHNSSNKSFTYLRADAPSFFPRSTSSDHSGSLFSYSTLPNLLINNSFIDPLSSFEKIIKETDYRLSNNKPNGLVITETYQSPNEILKNELKLIYSCGSSIVENSTDRINEIESILNQ